MPNLQSVVSAFNAAKSCQCPYECDTVTYDASVNRQPYYDANISKLFLFYRQLKYESITQIPKTGFPELISAIGGTLGLFVGLRLLSFVEILEFVLQLIYHTFKKLKDLILNKC